MILQSLNNVGVPVEAQSVDLAKDGVYDVHFNMTVSSNNEPGARQKAVEAIQKVIQENKDKGYDIELVSVSVLYNKAPVGVYQYTSAKYSTSGKDEYSVMANGKSTSFNP